MRSLIDGIDRLAEREHALNLLAARLFSTGGGKEFLDYLKDITVNRALEPNQDDRALRHFEGARWLVSIIQSRMKTGQQEGAPDYEPERPLGPDLPVP